MHSLPFQPFSRARRGVAGDSRLRLISRIFVRALQGEIAVLKPPRAGKPFRVVGTDGRYFDSIQTREPTRIVGVYRLRGDPHALLDALMSDLKGVELVGQ